MTSSATASGESLLMHWPLVIFTTFLLRFDFRIQVAALDAGVRSHGRIRDEIVENFDPGVVMRKIIVVFRSDGPDLKID